MSANILLATILQKQTNFDVLNFVHLHDNLVSI